MAKGPSGGTSVDGAPSADNLRRELAALRKSGALLEPDRIRQCPVLIELARVIRRRTDLDNSDAILDAKSVLLESIKDFEGESLTIISAAFALGQGNHFNTLDRRLNTVAVRLEHDVKTTRRREATLVGTLTYLLLERYQEVQLREAHGRLGRQQPTDPKLAIDWLKRFESYYDMWRLLSGIRNDLLAYQIRRRELPEDDALPVYSRSSLHYFAAYLLSLQRFCNDFGGLWLLSSADNEVGVAEAASRVTSHFPADDLEQSWLRTELRTVPNNEKYDYIRRIEQQPRGAAFIRRWADWMKQCQCDMDEPEADCPVHAIMLLVDYYMDTIDKEWYRIADWYRLPPSRRGAQIDQTKEVFENFNQVLPDLEAYQEADDSDLNAPKS